MTPRIILMLLIGIIVMGILVAMLIVYRKKKMPPTDYYTMFVMGIIFSGFGASQVVIYGPQMMAMLALGIIFMVVGITHRKDWKHNHKSWDHLSKEEQKMKIIILSVLGVLVLIGLLAFLFMALR